jgi:hypothetical protein
MNPQQEHEAEANKCYEKSCSEETGVNGKWGKSGIAHESTVESFKNDTAWTNRSAGMAHARAFHAHKTGNGDKQKMEMHEKMYGYHRDQLEAIKKRGGQGSATAALPPKIEQATVGMKHTVAASTPATSDEILSRIQAGAK